MVSSAAPHPFHLDKSPVYLRHTRMALPRCSRLRHIVTIIDLLLSHCTSAIVLLMHECMP